MPEDTNIPTPPGQRKAFKPSSETKAGDDPTKKKGKLFNKKERPEPTTLGGKLWYNWIKPIGSVVIVVVLVRSTLIDWNDVPTGSMEPEIHVGDRIAVNRLAYALQVPLTGPKIGIPFIGPQFDNPLDGIPQLQWGEPDRGDIVTFWNPITDIRMVKRIVAVPGDTIEMRNSVMIINGTAATYEDIDALAEGLDPQTTYKDGKDNTQSADLTYRRESLIGTTRLTQHIENNWANILIVRTPLGEHEFIRGKTFTQQVAVPSASDPRIPTIKSVTVKVDELIQNNPTMDIIARISDGKIEINGEDAGHEAFAKAVLEPYEMGPTADAFEKIGVAIKDGQLHVDGELVFLGQFVDAIKTRLGKLSSAEQQLVAEFMQARNGGYDLIQASLYTNFGPYTLNDREYFMVGDNRNNSSDSRFFGPVDLGEITGQAFAVAFSFEDNKMFHLPPDPALDRFFKDLD